MGLICPICPICLIRPIRPIRLIRPIRPIRPIRLIRLIRPIYAVSMSATAWSPNSWMLISRIRNFWILPVTVVGN